MFIVLFCVVCFAALSIPSGYEKFVHAVRSRIVIHEADLKPRNSTICKSINGPFCLIKPQKRSLHNFSLIDSVVSLKLFHTEDLKTAASVALNEFLNNNDVKEITRAETLEGRLDVAALSPIGSNGRIEPVGDAGLPVSISLQGPWKVDWRDRRAVLTAQRMGRIRFDEPVLVTSLVVHGKASVRGRYKKSERWRADSMDPNECKIGSDVFYRGRAQTIQMGTILLYDQNVVYLSDSLHDITVTRFRAEIVGLSGEDCQNVVDYATEPEDIIQRPMEIVDELFFFGEGEFDISQVQILIPKNTEDTHLREKFLMVLPNYHLAEREQSIFAPLWTVDELEQHGMEMDSKQFDVPSVVSYDIKVIPNRQFDHVMLGLEESATNEIAVSLPPGETKLVAEVQILRDLIKKDVDANEARVVHWEVYFNQVVETTGFDFLPYFMSKLPNKPLPKHVLDPHMVFRGSYQCGSSPTTQLTLRITSLAGVNVGAEFSFKTGEKRGSYLVDGTLAGRVLTLRPTPNGWKRKPGGFASIGLIGVVHKNPIGSLVYEGSVLSTGCGPFTVEYDADEQLSKSGSTRAQIVGAKAAKRRKAIEALIEVTPGAEHVSVKERRLRCTRTLDPTQCDQMLRALDDLRTLRHSYRTLPPEKDEVQEFRTMTIDLSKVDADGADGLIQKLKKILGQP